MPRKYLGNHTLLGTFNLSSKRVPEATTFTKSISKTPVKPPKHDGNHAPLGMFSLSSKRVPKLTTSTTSISTSPAKPPPAHTSTFAITDRWMDKREADEGNKARRPPPSPTISCKAPTNVGDTYTKTAGQRQISNVLACDSTTNCQQAYSQSVMVESSLTIVKGTTITLTGETSISITEDRKIHKIGKET